MYRLDKRLAGLTVCVLQIIGLVKHCTTTLVSEIRSSWTYRTLQTRFLRQGPSTDYFAVCFFNQQFATKRKQNQQCHVCLKPGVECWTQKSIKTAHFITTTTTTYLVQPVPRQWRPVWSTWWRRFLLSFHSWRCGLFRRSFRRRWRPRRHGLVPTRPLSPVNNTP